MVGNKGCEVVHAKASIRITASIWKNIYIQKKMSAKKNMYTHHDWERSLAFAEQRLYGSLGGKSTARRLKESCEIIVRNFRPFKTE